MNFKIYLRKPTGQGKSAKVREKQRFFETFLSKWLKKIQNSINIKWVIKWGKNFLENKGEAFSFHLFKYFQGSAS